MPVPSRPWLRPGSWHVRTRARTRARPPGGRRSASTAAPLIVGTLALAVLGSGVTVAATGVAQHASRPASGRTAGGAGTDALADAAQRSTGPGPAGTAPAGTAPTSTRPTRRHPVRLARPDASTDRDLTGAPTGRQPAGRSSAIPPLVEPDVLAVAPRQVTPAELAALRGRLPGSVVTVADAGRVALDGRPATVVGADPADVARFTPAVTAGSRPLWQRVRAGDVAVTFRLARLGHLPLGGTMSVTAPGRPQPAAPPSGPPASGPQPLRTGNALTGAAGTAGTTGTATGSTVRHPAPAGPAPAGVPVRIGAFAAFGLPGIDAVVSPATADRLGLAPRRLLLISAQGHDPAAIASAVRQTLGSRTSVAALHTVAPAQPPPQQRWPGTWRTLYQRAAATCPGLPWPVLAAIGTIESGNGRDTGPSSAGALGPMQFLPSTWAAYGVDADHDGRADITSPVDSVYSAARYLCDNGAGGGGRALYGAVYAYNHADWYVRDVLDLAARIH